ncbi:cytochrome c oxidase subunit II [soil metagenome]
MECFTTCMLDFSNWALDSQMPTSRGRVMTGKDICNMSRWVPGTGAPSGRVRLVLFALVTLLVSALLTACGGAEDNPQTTVAPAGPAADSIQEIYNLIWVLAAIVFVLVEGALIYAIFKFRGNRKMINGRPAPVHGNTRLEIIWTIIPAVILAVIAVPTIQGIATMAERDDDAFHVRVIGNQFFWEFEYPDIIGPDGTPLKVVDEMHIPVDTRIEITLESNDVIHSFWVPRLAGKTDAIPGRQNPMWLEASETGTYLGQCAEFCGTAHADMRFVVIADTQEDFDDWVTTSQSTPSDPVEAGLQIMETVCASCHLVEGTSAQGLVGPELTNFANNDQIADVVDNNEENLRAWLANPQEVKPGTAMPNLGLTEAQIDALVAYLNTLDGSGGE